MGKRRSCRRSADEDRIHEKAVKWRKMTDEQLVSYVEDRVAKARSEGFNEGKLKAERARQNPEKPRTEGAAGLLKHLRENKVPGIGAVTIKKLEGVAKEYGYIT